MIITLLTDFGLQDNYVGVIKGVIKTICPSADLIDLTHNIPPQDLFAASFALQNSIDYFPHDTIHIAVVDPTVGSERKAVGVVCQQGRFICPDNGILTGVLHKYKAQAVYQLNNPRYWLNQDVSATFHGRDIFAPIAAHLAKGCSWDDLGEAINPDDLVKLDLPHPTIDGGTITGKIQYIDVYGNLVTNIPASMLRGKSWYIRGRNRRISSKLTYSSVSPSELVTLIGSHGYVEIAVNGGSAKIVLGKKCSDMIEIKIK